MTLENICVQAECFVAQKILKKEKEMVLADDVERRGIGNKGGAKLRIRIERRTRSISKWAQQMAQQIDRSSRKTTHYDL
jgi:hypothetical protein